MNVTVARLPELEAVIERGIATFVEVGHALMEIRDARLYRPQFKTFELYCKARWHWSRSYADRQIEAAEVADLLPMGSKPGNERQARALLPLSKVKPEAVTDVIAEVRKRHGDAATARDFARAAEARIPRAVPKPVSDREQSERAIRASVDRLREWRAAYGHLRPWRQLVRLMDELLSEMEIA